MAHEFQRYQSFSVSLDAQLWYVLLSAFWFWTFDHSVHTHMVVFVRAPWWCVAADRLWNRMKDCSRGRHMASLSRAQIVSVDKMLSQVWNPFWTVSIKKEEMLDENCSSYWDCLGHDRWSCTHIQICTHMNILWRNLTTQMEHGRCAFVICVSFIIGVKTYVFVQIGNIGKWGMTMRTHILRRRGMWATLVRK